MKEPSKSAQLKVERAARAQAKREKKARDAAQLAELKERARSLVSRMPPEFAEWGVTKTRAYSRCLVILRNKAALKTIKADRLGVFVQHLERHNNWSMEHCQVLSTLSETAKSLPEQS